MDPKNNNKIIDIDQIELITNGNLEDFDSLINPNQVGKVINSEGEVISEITPLFMIINQNVKVYEKLDRLKDKDINLYQKIDYYGTPKTAKYILDNYRTK